MKIMNNILLRKDEKKSRNLSSLNIMSKNNTRTPLSGQIANR